MNFRVRADVTDKKTRLPASCSTRSKKEGTNAKAAKQATHPSYYPVIFQPSLTTFPWPVMPLFLVYPLVNQNS